MLRIETPKGNVVFIDEDKLCFIEKGRALFDNHIADLEEGIFEQVQKAIEHNQINLSLDRAILLGHNDEVETTIVLENGVSGTFDFESIKSMKDFVHSAHKEKVRIKQINQTVVTKTPEPEVQTEGENNG